MQHGMGGMCPTCGCGMGGHGMRGKGMKAMMMMPLKMMWIAEELGLSEDQKNKLRDIMNNKRKQKVQLKCQAKLARIDLMDMLFREQVNMQDVEQKIRELSKLKADMHIMKIQSWQDMKNTLTPEQREKMKAMMMSWWKDKMGGEGPMEMDEGEEEEEGEE